MRFIQAKNEHRKPIEVAHRPRKATPTQMVEGGATTRQVMAVTGHQSLEEVERYTRAAQRRKLADAAMAELKGE